MSKRNTMPDYDPVPSQRDGAPRPPKKKKKKGSGLFGRIELIAGPALPPERICLPGLQLQVAQLRGDWK